MPGDLAKDVNWDARVSHPRKSRVPKIVTTKLLISEFGHDLIPMGSVAQHRRTHPT
jgi:hypothetical protein